MRRSVSVLMVVMFFGLFIDKTMADGVPADDAISQLIRARVERMHDTRSHALQLRDLSLVEAVSQFYEYRNFQPAWIKPTHVEALLHELADIRDDGLDPEDYHLADLRQRYTLLMVGPHDATAQAEFDMMASQSYLRALAHLFRGKVKPTTLDAQWNFSLHDITATAAFGVVSAAVDTGDIASAFNEARPAHDMYKTTRAALAELRAIDARGGWPLLSTKTTLKPGMQDAQVAVLRQRLALSGYLPADQVATAVTNDTYDDELTAAVREFQGEQYLDTDGAIGPATRAALNVPIAARIDQVRVNLERGRWLLHDVTDKAVVVDIAGFKVYFLKDGKPVWQSNVQVGKPYRSTPIFKSNITYVTINPTWTVPPTIFKQDILPKVRRDRGYLAKNNMRVLEPGGKEIDAAGVNWNNPGNILLRADAGPENPLGQVVIRFPNPYAVYLHDTSHKELFVNSQRAFSSGCIRVERPLELVELLFDDAEKWSRTEIDNRIAENKTRNFDLAKPVPLLLAYWTFDVTKTHRLVFKPDIYKRDPALLQALNKRL